MRPLKIRLKNFGPYVDETVDFTRFFKAPLFLITGTTGSGKTTIFDGMCYALFNETSGKKRSGAQLRSDFASFEDETMVEFIFEHQDKIYTIKRWPKQSLAGKNGKVHEKKAKVALSYEAAGEKKSITKIPEAKRFIDDLLHLTAEQFTKVILLPQGQFRNFLAADSKEKEVVLRNLFGSELFERWTEALRLKFKQVNEKYQAKEQELQNLMQQAEFTSEIMAPKVWSAELKQWLATKNERLATWQVELETKKQLSEELQQQLLNEQELTAKITQLAKVNEKLVMLQADQEKQAQVKVRIASLKWAQQQQTLVDEFHKVQQEATTLTQELPQMVKKQQAQEKYVQKLANDSKKKQEESSLIEQKHYEMQTLATKLDLYQEVEALKLQLKQTKQKEQQSLAKSQKIRAKLEDIKQQLEKIACELKNLASLAQEKYQVETQLQEVVKLNAKNDELQQRKTNLITDKKRALDAKKAADIATNKARALENELAQIYLNKFISQLVVGKPCPVCGSVEHPHPGELHRGSKISEKEVKSARKVMNESVQSAAAAASEYNERQSEYEKQLSEFSQKVKGLIGKDELGGKSSLSELGLALQLFTKELTQKQERLAQEVTFLTKQQAKQSELKKDEHTQIQLEEQLTTRSQEYRLQQQELTTKCEEKQKQLPPGFSDQKKAQKQLKLWQNEITEFRSQQKQLEDELKKAEQVQIKLATEVKNLTMRQQTLQTTSATLQAKLTEKCTLAGRTMSELEELLTQVGELENLEKQVANQQKELSLIKGQRLTLTEQIAGRPTPRLEQTSKKLAATKEEMTKLQSLFGELSLQVNLKQKVYEKVQKILTVQADKLSELSQLKELVDAISGKGEQKLGFERYILQTYLQEVLVNANERLTQLTNGRYELCLNGSTGRGASSTGLELDIYDEHAGKRRSVHTLSGGESFLAALALALALGEVIQKKSGGIQIEALFVDEGFGSLDQVALQAALEVLQSLEDGKRMVGIISHVTELQTQLPDQLQVIATGERSTLRYQTER